MSKANAKTKIIKRPIERVGNEVKKSAWTAALESLAILVLGILFITWPEVMIQAITYIVGVFFIVAGAYNTMNYFIVKGQNDFFNNGLLSGIIGALIGIAVLIMGETIADVFRIVVGIFMIYEALARMNTSIKLHSVGINIWKYVLILALMMMALGIIVIFNTTTDIIGWIMIISGIIGIVGDIMFIQQVNNVIDRLTSKLSK